MPLRWPVLDLSSGVVGIAGDERTAGAAGRDGSRSRAPITFGGMRHERGDLHRLSRRGFLRTAGSLVVLGTGAPLLAACGGSGGRTEGTTAPARGTSVTLHRQEGCSCCASYAEYLEDNGFTVDMKTVDDLAPVRARLGIPDEAVGCHTSEIENYVVEGHVPVEAIDRLLSERSSLDGISVVGMPTNSPGMGDPNGEPLDVLSFRDGDVSEYMSITNF